MADLLAALRAVLGESGLLTDAAAKLVYAQDASHLHLGRPLAVALPATATEAAQVVRLCAEAGVAVVSRGSGTGLSGGAVPDDGQVVLSLSRLRALGPVDVDGAQVTAGAGVLNEDVTRHAAPCGLHFAPDPSSQSAASIGGNVAENAGGPHCLRYGVTLQHVLALDWVDAAGTRHRTGPAVALHRGLDLVSLLCGSEGTLGVITAADLALTRTEPACGTLLAFFDDLAAATSSVVRLLGSGLLPVAMEIVDQPMLQAVEAAFGFGFSTTAAAALITEFTGSEPSVTHDVEVARSLLADGGAGEVRLARDEAERLDLWKCRKKAFGAVGRLAPSYVTMDVVVPVGELPGLVGDIHRIQQAHDVHVATAFHAGDGNLHPGVHYDDRDPDQTRRAHIAADEIIAAALARGGSVTGEHGVGIEKLHALPWQLDAICADLQRGVAVAFDPRGRLNPGKALPPADGQFADLPPAPTGIDLRAESLIVSAPADAPMADLQAQALEHGLWLPVGIFGQAEPGTAGLGRGGTVGQLVEQLLPGPSLLAAGTARTYLLEYWGTTGDGRTFRSGAPVFKNVAGYALGPALCGSDDVFARCQGATFQLKPAPALVGLWRLTLPESGEAATVRIRALWQDLLIRDPGWAPPTLIIEPGSGTTTEIVVLATGGDQPWGLDQIDDLIARGSEDGCWQCPIRLRTPLTEIDDLLTSDHLPPWSLAGGTWTACSPLPQAEAGRTWSLGDGRAICQSAPRCLWVPQALDSARGWHVEPWLVDGRQPPLPRPVADVPTGVLQRLKALFDPDGVLGGPDWLLPPATSGPSSGGAA